MLCSLLTSPKPPYLQTSFNTNTIYSFAEEIDVRMANNNQNTESKSYKQQAGDFYNRQYDNWVPWIEDKYLQWFTKDNKASYTTKRKSLPLLHTPLGPPLSSVSILFLHSPRTTTLPSPNSTIC